MIISPSGYVSRIEDAEYYALIEERGRLVAYIIQYEKNEKAGDRTSEEWFRDPRPDVRYQMHLEYLAELCQLMHEKYNEEYVWGGNCLSESGEYRYGRKI